MASTSTAPVRVRDATDRADWIASVDVLLPQVAAAADSLVYCHVVPLRGGLEGCISSDALLSNS